MLTGVPVKSGTEAWHIGRFARSGVEQVENPSGSRIRFRGAFIFSWFAKKERSAQGRVLF
jgi:hypothetical protein